MSCDMHKATLRRLVQKGERQFLPLWLLMTVVCVSAAKTVARAQQLLPAISGTVIDGTTDEPVPDAIVTFTPADLSSGQAVHREATDSRGRFVVTNLAHGRYVVRARKTGYSDGAYGQTRLRSADPVAIAISSEQWFDHANVTLWRLGTIEGKVTDELGAPVVGVFVRALTWRLIRGESRVVGGPFALTDDRGEYRLGHLSPGAYTVVVPSERSTVATPKGLVEVGLSSSPAGHYPLPPVSPDGSLSYPTTFPGSRSLAGATIVQVGSGTVERLDVALSPVRTVSVSGQVIDGGPRSAPAFLRLVDPDLDTLGMVGTVATTIAAASGEFHFRGVPPGSYVLEMPLRVSEYTVRGSSFELSYGPRPPMPPGVTGGIDATLDDGPKPGIRTFAIDGASGWASVPLVVGLTELSGVIVKAESTVAVDGRLVIDAPPQTGRPTLGRPGLVLQVEDGAGWRAITGEASADGSVPFRFDQLRPDTRYLLRPSGRGWVIKSVTVDGIDHTDEPLAIAGAGPEGIVVTVTTAAATLTGSVSAVASDGGSGACVVAWLRGEARTNTGRPVAPNLHTARADTQGVYRLDGLTQGVYNVLAVPSSIDPSSDPTFVARMSNEATLVSVRWGAQQTVDLKMIVQQKASR
jgi:Carboxypeptidase regulatory-like domain